MPDPGYLSGLGLYHDIEAHFLVYFRDKCKFTLSMKDSRVTTYLLDRYIPIEACRGFSRFLKSLP